MKSCARLTKTLFAALLVLGSLHSESWAAADSPVVVHNRTEFLTALRASVPGTTILLAPGIYDGTGTGNSWGLPIENRNGAPDKWITIDAEDPNNPPVITGYQAGVVFYGSSYIKVRNIRVENVTDNGIHATAGASTSSSNLSSSNHIVIENCTILNSGNGDWGNHDGIKMGGTDFFTVRNVTIDGWGLGGGSAIDIDASQYGVIENSIFTYRALAWTGSLGNSTGVTIKMGSRGILMRNNFFSGAGVDAVQIGQDSGLQYFRDPPGTVLADGTVMNYEAKDIEVSGNRINGAIFSGASRSCPLFWMKSTDSLVHHNTVVMVNNPAPAAQSSILGFTSSTNDGLLSARNAKTNNNLFAYKYGTLYKLDSPFATGATSPMAPTFTFANNAWFQVDVAQAGAHLPNTVGNLGLPTAETNPVYQVDPQFSIDLNTIPTGDIKAIDLAVKSLDPNLMDKGADAYLKTKIISLKNNDTFDSLPITVSGIVDDQSKIQSVTLTLTGLAPIDITSSVRNGSFSYNLTNIPDGTYDLEVKTTYAPFQAAEVLNRTGSAVVTGIKVGAGFVAPSGPTSGEVNVIRPGMSREAVLRIVLEKPSQVEVKIFNRAGLVRSLVNSDYPAGTQEIRWDGKSDAGEVVASGVYSVTIQFGGKTQTRKIAVVR